MAGFKTLNLDSRQLRLGFALLLIDGFTQGSELFGRTTVRVAGQELEPMQKWPEATFLFFDLPAGAHIVQVRSNERESGVVRPADKPYYMDLDLAVTLPMPNPLWPAFPDISLANPDKRLEDPTQPAAYRAQRRAASLQPSTAYPFPDGTTLVRGTVRSGGTPVEGATVRRVNDEPEYVTAADGDFVLFFREMAGVSQVITLEASHPFHPLTIQNVTLNRGRTVVRDITLP